MKMKLMLSWIHKRLKEEEPESLKHFQAGRRATQRDKELPSSLKDHYQLSSP